jgi:hypothetical protein
MKLEQLIELAKDKNPVIWGEMTDKRGVLIAKSLLTEILIVINEFPEGNFRVQGLGTFKINIVDRVSGSGKKKRVIFQPRPINIKSLG